MAHPAEKRIALRKSYVFDRLPLTTSATKHKVSVATAQNWKNKAKAMGDDWDKERDAYDASAMGMEEATSRMLRNHIKQHNATMELLELPAKDGGIVDPLERIKALATAADSYSKLLAAHRKYSPQISELATALDVMTFFSDYLENNHRDLLKDFLPALESFGRELSKRYG